MGNPVDYASGDPIANLALVRSLFFPAAGQSLGTNKRPVMSQAQIVDAAHPEDAAYIENVMWEQSNVLFGDQRAGRLEQRPGRLVRRAHGDGGADAGSADRTGADLRWLDLAFAQSAGRRRRSGCHHRPGGHVGSRKGAAHQTGYEPFVSNVAPTRRRLESRC